MKFGLNEERFDKINKVFSRFAAIDEVIIFGSRALNTSKMVSDIDFAIIGENIPYEDILKLNRALDELPYGYTYDLFDYKKITNPQLLSHIDSFGISFYKRII